MHKRRGRAGHAAGRPRKDRETFLYDLLYFVSVLALAGLFLNAWPSIRPDQSFEQREVAKQVALVLNVFGAKTDFYEWWVRIPNSVPPVRQGEISSTLKGLGFEEESMEYGLALHAREIDSSSERTAQAYLDEQARKGAPLAVSKATLAVGGRTEVEIIQDCVGWLGFFAITALILAYPRLPWKKRAVGMLIAWPLMYAANMVRLTTSIYVAAAAGLPLFDLTHNLLWKISLLIIALVIWLFWVYFIVEQKTWNDFKASLRSFKRRTK